MTGTPSTEGVSIVICCYNSSERLPQTLKHIAAQQVPSDLNVEVIVVDNNSTDDTGASANQLWRDLGEPFKLRVVVERRPGLTNARIRGIESSQYEIIVFCDDDNWLDPDYLRIAHEIMSERPMLAVAGGMTTGVFDADVLPEWFDAISGGFAVGGSPGRCDLPVGSIVWGAGMVVRRSAWRELFSTGFEFVCSDRQGSNLSAGGDAELCHALQWIGYTLHHDGRLRLRHWIPASRVTWKYAIDLSKGFGAATIANDAVRLLDTRNEKTANLVRKSFIYHLVRGGAELLPVAKRLLQIGANEGDISCLSKVSKLGRWEAIAALNLRYSGLISRKAKWLERNRHQPGRRAH